MPAPNKWLASALRPSTASASRPVRGRLYQSKVADWGGSKSSPLPESTIDPRHRGKEQRAFACPFDSIGLLYRRDWMKYPPTKRKHAVPPSYPTTNPPVYHGPLYIDTTVYDYRPLSQDAITGCETRVDSGGYTRASWKHANDHIRDAADGCCWCERLCFAGVSQYAGKLSISIALSRILSPRFMIRSSPVDGFDFQFPHDLQGCWPSTESVKNLANFICETAGVTRCPGSWNWSGLQVLSHRLHDTTPPPRQ